MKTRFSILKIFRTVFIVFLLFIIASLAEFGKSEASVPADTSRSIESSTSGVFITPQGNYFEFEEDNSDDGFEDEDEEEAYNRDIQLNTLAAGDVLKKNCQKSSYDGTKRAAAKTSYATAKIKNYSSLNKLLKLLNSGNMTDEKMRERDDISSDKNSKRISLENKNVFVETAYLIALKREDDEDFHLIISNSKEPESADELLNAEISGLPPKKSKFYKKLKLVRDVFENYFNGKCFNDYKVFKEGIEIQIEGSLFYDIDHKPGVVGTKKYKPLTSWEIHPITDIIFMK